MKLSEAEEPVQDRNVEEDSAGRKKKEKKKAAVCTELQTHKHTLARAHTLPPCLSWPLLLLYVWHAAWKLRLRGVYQGNSLSTSAPLPPSLHIFPPCLTSPLPHTLPLGVTPRKPRQKCLRKRSLRGGGGGGDALVSRCRFLPSAGKQQRRQPRCSQMINF